MWNILSKEIENELGTGCKYFYNTIQKQAKLLSMWMEGTGKMPDDIGDVIEFGAGFGSMCQVLLPFISGKYYIIDLPVMATLQKAYLKKMSGIEWSSLDVLDNCDMFIATYSLSETNDTISREVLGKKLFNAKSLLITFNDNYGGELTKLKNDGLTASDNGWVLIK